MAKLIAVIGRSGSGKTSFINLLKERLNYSMLTIHESLYYLNKINPEPSTFDREKLFQELPLFKNDPNTEVVFIEGLFLMAIPELLKFFDLTIYIDAPPNWLQQSNQNEVIEHGNISQDIYQKYIEPYKTQVKHVIDNCSTTGFKPEELSLVADAIAGLFKNTSNNLADTVNLYNLRKNTGTLFIVSGPSGAGKSTLIKQVTELAKKIDGLERVITYTTRKPRVGEASQTMFNGKPDSPKPDYYFISREEFTKGIENNEFILYRLIHDNLYGPKTESICEPLAKGQDLIIDVDKDAACELRQKIPNSVAIFIGPAKPEQLETQLKARGEKDLDNRLAKGKQLLQSPDLNKVFDYIIINPEGEVDKARKELKHIILAKRTEARKEEVSFVPQM